MIRGKVVFENAFKLGRQPYQIGGEDIFSRALEVRGRDIGYVLVYVVLVPILIDKSNPLPRRLKFTANSAKPLDILFAHAVGSRSAQQVFDQSNEVVAIPFLVQHKTRVNTHLPVRIMFIAQQAHPE